MTPEQLAALVRPALTAEARRLLGRHLDGRAVIRWAISAGMRATSRGGFVMSERSVRACALALLGGLVDEELSKMVETEKARVDRLPDVRERDEERAARFRRKKVVDARVTPMGTHRKAG